jgi:hypothetical protein
LFEQKDVIDMSRLLYQIPLVGLPYEFVSTGSIRHSAPGSITQFLTVTAAKRLTHWYLGSAGGMMPYQHYIQIVKEESAALRQVIGKQPPRVNAFATLGVGVVMLRHYERLV